MEGSIRSVPPPSELEAKPQPTEDNEKEGTSEKESQKLNIDPKWCALRSPSLASLTAE